MHEMSLCESIVQILEEQAREQQFARVRRVVLEIGALSAVDTRALRFCFDAVTERTLAAGAALDIHELPGLAWCLPCGAQVEVAQRHDACPRCGGHQTVVQGGEDMRIKELEVD